MNKPGRKMKIAMTGASGFLGSRLVSKLLSEGHEVHVLGRRRSSDLPERAYFTQWDAPVGPPPVEVFEGAGAVIHLAGEPVSQRWNDEVKKRIRDTRVIGTNHLVEAIGRAVNRPGKLVSASAIGFYGFRDNEVLTETSTAGNGFLPDVCKEWESSANVAREFGLKVATLRISLILSPDGGALAKMLPAFRMGVGGNLGSGKQWMSWVHVDDMIEIVMFALTGEVDGPINACAPNPVRNAEFTKAMGSALHRPTFFAVPKLALSAMFGEMADVMLGSQRVVPEKLEKAGFRFQYPAIGPALRNLLGG